VVIAAYNVAALIGDALESVFAQTYPPREVIVCNDGSTDDLEGALAPYADRITLIRKENGGEGSAKNAAARSASGDFVVILDADDTYMPGRLEALAELAHAHSHLDILTTDAFLESNGERVRRCYTDTWTFEVADQRRGILERNFIFGHVAVRRQRFLDAGGFDETIRWTTDWDCWIRLILDGARAGCVLEPLAVYRIHESGLSADRASLVSGRLQTLAKAARREDLSGAERETLQATIAKYERELALLRLRASLRDGKDDARRRALAVARDRRFPARTRALAAAATLLPRMVGRRERRRNDRSWVGAGGTHVRR
jgi:GT2 family glycosyltransferase